ncbi:MAG: protein kinase [Pirellulaceae bacterium]
MSKSTDRNLLIGILALQMDFISQNELISAMHDWIADKSHAIDEILLKKSVVTEEVHALLVALVEKHLELHENDTQQSLAALSPCDVTLNFVKDLDDSDLNASLMRLTEYRSESIDQTAPFVRNTDSGQSQRFRVLRPHAKGGLGQVFVAIDQELDREVALKEIQERFANDGNFRSRFLNEAKITGGLEHPGVVPIYGLGKYADGRPFYAMRFIKGDSLKEAVDEYHHGKRALDDRPTVEFRQLLGRFIDVCYAVEYAHSRGVLHRDLKPGNVMLGKYGETLVVDWGLAKIIGRGEAVSSEETTLRPIEDTDATPTLQGEALGTPGFMSPEQAAGKLSELGPASDVYSLGATLYYVVTGRVPFTKGNGRERLSKIMKGDFPSPRELVPTLPRALEAITLKAMSLRADERYASAALLAKDIELFLADEPISACREPLSVVARRWLGKHRTFVAVAASILLLTSLVGPIVAYQQSQLAKRSQQLFDSERDKFIQQEQLTQEQTKTALQQAQLAAQERANAQQQAELRTQAEEQKELAETKQKEAERAEKLATDSNYAGQLQFAAKLIDDGHYGDAKSVLQTVRRDLQDWCFNHLWSRLQNELSPILIAKGFRITSVSASPDGQYFLTAATNDKDVRVELWDAETHRVLRSLGIFRKETFRVMKVDESGRTIRPDEPGPKTVVCSAFNQSSDLFATGGVDGIVRVFETNSGELVYEYNHGSFVRSVDFTPFSDTLASTGTDGICRLWSLQEEASGRELARHSTVVTAAAFSPDGRQVATAGADGSIRLWNVATGDLVRSISSESHPVHVVAFSSEGDRLVSSSTEGALLWDVSNGQLLRRLKFTDRMLSSLAWSADGSRILGAGDQLVVEWDAQVGDVIRSIPVPTGTILSACYSRADSDILVGGSDGRGFVVKASPSPLGIKTDLGSTVNSSDVDLAGKRIAVGTESGRVVLMDLTNHDILAEYQCNSAIISVSFSRDNSRLAIGTQRSGVLILDGQTLTQLQQIAFSDQISSAKFSPDGSRLLVYRSNFNQRGSPEHRAFVIEIDTGSPVFELTLNPSERNNSSQPVSIQLETLTFNHGGTLIAGCVGKSIYVWDAHSGEFLFRVTGIHGLSTALDFSSDDKHLARGTLGIVSSAGPAELPGDLAIVGLPVIEKILEHHQDGTPPSFEDTIRLAGHTDRIQAVAFDPNNRFMASASWDGSIRIWNTESGVSRLQLNTKPHGLRSLHVSRDGSKLVCVKRAMGSTKHFNFPIRIYDLESGKLKWELPGCLEQVKQLVFSPDRRLLASYSQERLIEIWELETGQKKLIKHVVEEVGKMAFSPDGLSLAYGSKDGKLGVCSLKDGDQVEASCPASIQQIVWTDSETIHCQYPGDQSETFRLVDAQWISESTPPASSVFQEMALSDVKAKLETIRIDGKLSFFNELQVQSQTKNIAQTFPTTSYRATAWAIDPSGKEVAISDYAPRARDGTEIETYVWSARVPESLPMIGQEKDVRAIAHSDDGKKLFSGGFDRKICIWDTQSGVSQLQFRRFPVVGLAVHPDDSSIVYQDSNDRLFTMNSSQSTAEGLPLVTQIFGDSSSEFSYINFGLENYRRRFLDFDSAGNRICFGKGKDIVICYPALIPMSVTLASQDSRVSGAFFRPQDQSVLSFGDDGLYVWNCTSGELAKRLPAKNMLKIESAQADTAFEVQTLAVAKQARKIFAAVGYRHWTEDRSQVNEGVYIATLGLDDLQPEAIFEPDLELVTSIAVNSDGKYIAVGVAKGSNDMNLPGLVVLYDSESGAEVARFDDDIGLVLSQSFHPQKPELVIGTFDGQVHVWEYERTIARAASETPAQ